MKTEAIVMRVDKFISKKGNPCLWIHVKEPDVAQYKVLVFDPQRVNNPPSVGSKIQLSTEPDSSYTGTLKLSW